MKNIFRIFAFFVCISIVTVLLIYSTMALQGEKTEDNPKGPKQSVSFSVPDFSQSGTILQKKLPENISSGDIIYADFGRLSSAFLLAEKEMSREDIQSEIQHNDGKVTIGNMGGFFSWYDPFKNYIISDKENTFTLSEITNGTVYVKKEPSVTVNGKEVAILNVYSVDSVSELTFLYENEKMTSMIIFPGMSVQINVNENRLLKGLDVLRIRQYAEVTDSKDTNNDSVGVNFLPVSCIDGSRFRFGGNGTLNERMQNGSALISALRNMFISRFDTIDAMKKYIKEDQYGFVSGKTDTKVSNPSKNTYRRLGQLQIIFSRALNDEITETEFAEKVQEIIDNSETEMFREKAYELLKQFLIDGRFALFMNEGENLTRYQLLYNKAAEILKITPTRGKGLLFQSLSDIFSKNVVNNQQKSNNNSCLVKDQTTHVARALRGAMAQQGLDGRDYFDITLYAFEILRQKNGESATSFSRIVLEDEATYWLLEIVFKASQRYVNSISNGVIRINAQNTFLTKYYRELLELLTNGIYQEYTDRQDNTIKFRLAFLSNNLPSLDRTFVSELNKIFTISQEIYQKVKTSVRNPEIEKYLEQINGFLYMQKDYPKYRDDPYLTENPQSILPKYDATTQTLMTARYDNVQNYEEPQTGEVIQNLEENKKIVESFLKKFPLKVTIDANKVQKISDTEYKMSTVFFGKNITFVYAPGLTTVSRVEVKGGIEFKVLDTFMVTNFYPFLQSVPVYEQKIQKILNENPRLSKQNITLYLGKSQIQIQGKNFPIN